MLQGRNTHYDIIFSDRWFSAQIDLMGIDIWVIDLDLSNIIYIYMLGLIHQRHSYVHSSLTSDYSYGRFWGVAEPQCRQDALVVR